MSPQLAAPGAAITPKILQLTVSSEARPRSRRRSERCVRSPPAPAHLVDPTSHSASAAVILQLTVGLLRLISGELCRSRLPGRPFAGDLVVPDHGLSETGLGETGIGGNHGLGKTSFCPIHDQGKSLGRARRAFWIVGTQGLWETRARPVHGLAGTRGLGKSVLPCSQDYRTVNCSIVTGCRGHRRPTARRGDVLRTPRREGAWFSGAGVMVRTHMRRGCKKPLYCSGVICLAAITFNPHLLFHL